MIALAWHGLWALLIAALVPAAFAQAPAGEVERALLQRQQYQEELAVRQRQFAERLDPALTPAQRQQLERRQLDERNRQQALHQSQVRQLGAVQQALPHLPEQQQRRELIWQSQEFLRQRTDQAIDAGRDGP